MAAVYAGFEAGATSGNAAGGLENRSVGRNPGLTSHGIWVTIAKTSGITAALANIAREARAGAVTTDAVKPAPEADIKTGP